HAVIAGIENCSQDCAAQQAYEQEVIEVTCLKRCILPVVRKSEQLPLLCWDATIVPVHPFKGGGDELSGRRASAFTGKPCQLASLTHARVRLVKTTWTETELAGNEPEMTAGRIISPVLAHRDHLRKP